MMQPSSQQPLQAPQTVHPEGIHDGEKQDTDPTKEDVNHIK